MKNLLLFVFLSIGLVTNAQNENFSISPTIGVCKAALSNGIGFHLGINPSFVLTPHLSFETQISYLYCESLSSFMSNSHQLYNSTNALAGGRLYLNSDERSTRFYFNLLFGINYDDVKTLGINASEYSELNLGYSYGFSVEFNRLLIGLSVETLLFTVLKLGYNI